MEITYADTANGGDMEDNLIPELTALSEENINFSKEGLNGGYALSGTTFTTGGLVAQTAGVPLNTAILGTNYNLDGEYYLLPGVWNLGDILEQEGYHQVLMVGSDGNFGGRSLYFRGHGDYEIYDHDKVMSIGWLPSGYMEWWGYEDAKLVEFAKVEIQNLAAEGEPFNFTMLTADTHFTAGYYCELCDDEYDSQYSNVIACSSRQIAGLVEWIKEQDFYENTTIVISGDHLTMDSNYMEGNMVDMDYPRRTFFTIINAPESCVEKERERDFSTIDIYPTTLAALGVTIEGDRLGLGVNLFSDIPTLYEEFGEDYLNAEFLKNSDFYRTLIY
jgi:phosphoglycerol transferase